MEGEKEGGREKDTYHPPVSLFRPSFAELTSWRPPEGGKEGVWGKRKRGKKGGAERPGTKSLT